MFISKRIDSVSACSRRRSYLFCVVALSFLSITRDVAASPDEALAVNSIARSDALRAQSKMTAESKTPMTRVRLGDHDDSAAIGPENAPVTIVAFVDYECAFCARAHGTLDELVAKYGDVVRVVFKHNPLAFHKNAPLAAEAALAAADLGEFDSMHQLLTKHQRELEPEKLPEYAVEAGLDRETFETALESRAFQSVVQADIDLAKRIGVTATPFFFVNGRPLRGAKSLGEFSTVIDDELTGAPGNVRWVEQLDAVRHPARAKKARETTRSGAIDLPSASVRRDMAAMKAEIRRLRLDFVRLRKSVERLERNSSMVRERDATGPVPTIRLDATEPGIGSEEAEMGLVVFNDYQSPESRSFALQVLPLIEKTYVESGQVRVVFLDLVRSHDLRGETAAIAANCAGRQNAYRKMYDAVFSHAGLLDQGEYEQIAERLELDTGAFLACLADEDRVERREIQQDTAYASSLGVHETPALFIGDLSSDRLLNAMRPAGNDWSTLAKEIDTILESRTRGTNERLVEQANGTAQVVLPRAGWRCGSLTGKSGPCIQ